MSDEISATEAAQILGVSLATLYSYVSRGLLQSSATGAERRKRYARDAVLRLAARNADGKRAGHQVAAAMHWGLPVLETHISRIANGQLQYRGHNAVELSAWASLEQTALLLWDCPDAAHFEHAALALSHADVTRANAFAGDMAPLPRAQAVLPLLARALSPAPESPAQLYAQGAQLMRLLGAILIDAEPSAEPLHQQLARRWQTSVAATDIIRASLVLMADHELNTSAFTVRCVASSGADLALALSAGMAALVGPQHGGSVPVLRDALDCALRGTQSATGPAFDALLQIGRSAGFGHPLYPQGDPRAACLLNALSQISDSASDSPAVVACRRMLELGQATGEVIGAPPNSDFALAAVEVAFGLPRDACQTLFALGRSAGWIAHAVEQRASGQLIRPRARYVGRFASES